MSTALPVVCGPVDPVDEISALYLQKAKFLLTIDERGSHDVGPTLRAGGGAGADRDVDRGDGD